PARRFTPSACERGLSVAKDLVAATNAETGTLRDLATPSERRPLWQWLAGPKLLAGASILAVWWFASSMLPPDVVPPPPQVATAMGKLLASGDAWFHLRQTLTRILLGFAVAALLGMTIGLLMG